MNKECIILKYTIVYETERKEKNKEERKKEKKTLRRKKKGRTRRMEK